MENLFKPFGREIFRSIMTAKRFKQISRAIRFDDYANRRQMRSSDRFAPIRDFWDKWSAKLPLCFNPYAYVTVDEQLLAFRGRCKFRMYMPSKPAKYGIKFWILADNKTGYVWKIQPYLGRSDLNAAPEKQQGKRVVLDLVAGLKGHNVTIDNFFTSYELAEELLRRKLTMVGTMRQNKACIPPEMKMCKNVPLYTSKFAFRKNATMVSYIGRKNKCTILLSTMHKTSEYVPDHPKKLPEIIGFYNSTKCN